MKACFTRTKVGQTRVYMNMCMLNTRSYKHVFVKHVFTWTCVCQTRVHANTGVDKHVFTWTRACQTHVYMNTCLTNTCLHERVFVKHAFMWTRVCFNTWLSEHLLIADLQTVKAMKLQELVRKGWTWLHQQLVYHQKYGHGTTEALAIRWLQHLEQASTEPNSPAAAQ